MLLNVVEFLTNLVKCTGDLVHRSTWCVVQSKSVYFSDQDTVLFGKKSTFVFLFCNLVILSNSYHSIQNPSQNTVISTI